MTHAISNAASPMGGGDMYSTAFQFYSHINGSVDPRTGMYGANIELATGQGNRLRGPNFLFRLSYSALSDTDEGFGRGWHLGVTELVPGTPDSMVSLSEGETHKVSIRDGNEGVFPDRKLDSFSLILPPGRLDRAEVRHIGGTVEYLERSVDSSDTLRPVRIVQANGDGIHLHWVLQRGIACLGRVTDDEGVTLLEATYEGSQARLRITVEHGSFLEAIFTKQAGQLDTVTLPTINRLNTRTVREGEQARWEFGYRLTQDGTMLLLKSIISPDGIEEVADYQENAIPLPTGAPRSHMPAAVERTRRGAGGQGPLLQRSTYAYDVHGVRNFYGNGVVERWEDRNDQLLHFIGDYDYGSLETQYDPDGSTVLCTIERTYNHFHLIRSEVVRRGDVEQRTVTLYGDRERLPFEDQPKNFQLPRRIEVTRSSRNSPLKQSTHVENDYDDMGNVTRHVDSATGMTETSTYYPHAGETAPDGEVLCPPDPLGLVRRLKSKTVTPGPGGGPVLTTEYRYVALPIVTREKQRPSRTTTVRGAACHAWACVRRLLRRLVQVMFRPGSAHPSTAARLRDDRETFVQCSTEIVTSTEDGTTKVLTRVDRRFVTDGGHQHGSLRQESREQDGLREVHDYTYENEPNDGGITTHTTHTTHDGIVNTSRETRAPLSGLVKRTVDEIGNRTDFEHDTLGRMTVQHLSPDAADYHTTVRWAYQLSMSERSVTRTGITGLKHMLWMDEQGRPVKRRETIADGSEMDVHELAYDALGQLTREIHYDRLSPSREVRLETRYAYDDWGQCCRRTEPDGSATVRETFLDTLDGKTSTVVRQWQEYGGKRTAWQQIWTDDAGRQLRVDTGAWQADGTTPGEPAATRTWAYDGLGRCIRMTEPFERVTAQAWDARGRLTETTLPDGTLIRRTFASGHEDELIDTLFAIPPGEEACVLGKRTWDGLGRLTGETAGSLNYVQTYESGKMSPVQRTMPGGGAIRMTYDSRLDEVLNTSELVDRRGTHSLLTGAEYDTKLGLPTSIRSDAGTLSIRPDILGRMTRQTIELTGDRARDFEVTVSFGGRELVKKGVDGVTRTFSYDDFGRVQMVRDDDVSVSLSYDGLSRLHQRLVRSVRDGNRAMTETREYDVFGRIDTVSWAYGSESSQYERRLKLVWRIDDKLEGRLWYDGAGTVVREEHMTYDVRGRLERHDIVRGNDDEYPLDEMRNAYRSQRFEYDFIDNITLVETTLRNGAVNRTIYGYDSLDIDRLVSVSNSLPGYPGYGQPIELLYDANGNLTDDGQGRRLVWDDAGRLSSIVLPYGTELDYVHGPDGRVGAVRRGDLTTFRYRDDGLIVYEHSSEEGRRYLRTPGGIVAETRIAEAVREILLLGVDPQGSVVIESRAERGDLS